MSALPVFDTDEVAVVTKDGLHKNMPVLIKKLSSGYKTPYSKSKEVWYDCETTDDPPKIIVVNEKDLVSFDQYLEDMDLLDSLNDEDDDFNIFKALEEIMPELELELKETDLMKQCECGAEKSQIGDHSTWCPKYG